MKPSNYEGSLVAYMKFIIHDKDILEGSNICLSYKEGTIKLEVQKEKACNN